MSDLPPPPIESSVTDVDFLKGDAHVGLRLAQTGATLLPWSIVTAFGGWSEQAITVDFGVATQRVRTWSIGLDLTITESALLSARTRRKLNNEVARFRWGALELAPLMRAGLHWDTFDTVDVYVFTGAGPTWSQTRVSATENNTLAEDVQLSQTWGVRVASGAGIHGRLKNSPLMLGVELRYQLGVRFQPTSRYTFSDSTGEPFTILNTRDFMRDPRGFSWSFLVGLRL